MHISPSGAPTPLISITDESMMAVQNNSHSTANGDDDIGVGNKLNFYPAVDEDYETRRAEQQTESLIPLKEDLADWIQRLLDIPITTDTFLQVLDNGAALCRLAFLIQSKAEEASREGKCQETIPRLRFRCRENAKSRTWYARDNTANFLRWCRDFGINEGCMFESEDLVCHRQEKPVVVCLLELARLGYRFGLEPPSIIKIEKEIEREESELASQLNDDDPQDEAEAEEVGAGSDAGDGSGDDEEEADEGKGKKGREKGRRGGSDSKEKEDVKENGQEEEAEEGDGEEDENEKSESVDGTDGNVGNESTSDGHKSRTTSRATSHVSGQNDNEENGEVEDEDNEDKDADGEEEKDDVDDDDGGDKEDGEGVNGTMNGTSVDENANEENDKESSSETKGGLSRPNSPTKTDSGTTSPTRRSPTTSRSRIDKMKARQLDKKVKHVASEHNVSEHVNQISEGKYCIFGRVVFIRLLKEKHLMVRVGGGWDTLDHYLSHHSPTKILEFKRNDQVKTPTTSPKHDPDTGETAATNNTSGDEKYLVISGKYKRN